ncbi:MAG: stimulus-sensing domain-containing protein [Alphaproteobacteria bacterium]
MSQSGGRGPFSRLTRRILALNVVPLLVLAGGVLYMGEYHDRLIAAELAALRTQGVIFASALGEGAVAPAVPDGYELRAVAAQQMLRRLVRPVGARARLFSRDGDLLADSRIMTGTGGHVQVEALPPPGETIGLLGRVFGAVTRYADWMPGGGTYPRYRESPVQRAADYDEVARALAGEGAAEVRARDGNGLVLSAAVPVQRYKQVLGAVMLSRDGAGIERALRAVRLDVLAFFAGALAVTVLLSVLLAGTLARPIRRLAEAADRVRHGRGHRHEIPDFTRRGDEIGDLSGALRDMTAALWERMEAIEGFAADVAHEIKNPLSSLRSAVETAVRVEDPDQQRRLMAIVVEDVKRLDRLISDISDASRLDADLARAEMAPVDLGRLLAALVEVYEARRGEGGSRLVLDAPEGGALTVPGMEGRLAQLFRNLIDNAVSFSPPGGTIEVGARVEGSVVVVTVADGGPGIPPDNLEDIFERFYTERPEGEKFGTHSGLGLGICRQIAEAHDGEIRAENRLDPQGGVIGARFVVRLRRA